MSRAKMTAKTHIAMHAREYAGESLALPLLAFLNSAPKKKKARIEALLRASFELSSALAVLRRWPQSGPPLDVFGKKMADVEAFPSSLPSWPLVLPKIVKSTAVRKIRKQINSVLRQYRLIPEMIPTEKTRWGLDGWEVIWGSPGPGRVNGINDKEALLLQRLLELAKDGLLSKLRRCGNVNCNRWFYARFEHQRYHSTPCQTSDPEWKKQRNDYMKKLRQLHKRR